MMGKYLVFSSNQYPFIEGTRYYVKSENNYEYLTDVGAVHKKNGLFTFSVKTDTLSGGNCDYYTAKNVRVKINGKWVLADVTWDEYAHALQVTPEEFNIGKEIVRLANGRQGRGKEGNTEKRGAEKMVHYANKKLEWVTMDEK